MDCQYLWDINPFFHTHTHTLKMTQASKVICCLRWWLLVKHPMKINGNYKLNGDTPHKKKSWHIFFDIVLETLWLNMHYVHIKPSTDIIFPHLHISFYSHEEREKKYLSFSHLFTSSWNFFSAFIFLIIWKTRNLCRKFFFPFFLIFLSCIYAKPFIFTQHETQQHEWEKWPEDKFLTEILNKKKTTMMMLCISCLFVIKAHTLSF